MATPLCTLVTINYVINFLPMRGYTTDPDIVKFVQDKAPKWRDWRIGKLRTIKSKDDLGVWMKQRSRVDGGWNKEKKASGIVTTNGREYMFFRGYGGVWKLAD